MAFGGIVAGPCRFPPRVDIPRCAAEGVTRSGRGLPVETVNRTECGRAQTTKCCRRFADPEERIGTGLDTEGDGRLATAAFSTRSTRSAFLHPGEWIFPGDHADRRVESYRGQRWPARSVRGERADDRRRQPAACALGCRGDVTVTYRGQGARRTLEKPRQVSAYRYPERYGSAPRLFRARADAAGRDARARHIGRRDSPSRTQHVGDIGEQAKPSRNPGLMEAAATRCARRRRRGSP